MYSFAEISYAGERWKIGLWDSLKADSSSMVWPHFLFSSSLVVFSSQNTVGSSVINLAASRYTANLDSYLKTILWVSLAVV